MHLRILVIKSLFLWFLGMNLISNFDIKLISLSVFDLTGNPTLDRISVRESNYELQVSVGDKIFVFGKAKGTLDKIKVGMNVLHFAQVAEIEGNFNRFSKVSWKKLKDGSIQIFSSYEPWPHSLYWTVYADGQLKMEASGPPENFKNVRWLGLGFDYPEQMLNQVSWKSASSDFGQWKNSNFVPMANPEIEFKIANQGFFQPIQSVKLEFETVTLDVSTETSGVFLSLGEDQNQNLLLPKLKTDLAFFFNQPIQNSELLPQTPSATSPSRQISAVNPLVLWFLFQ
ncbi:hypothetical protein [Algoriphagus sp.]|uniref:hypothetical protein n=1 Tax=Algoriphagus sp. TaxID=1872435 RepID=UPI00391D0002